MKKRSQQVNMTEGSRVVEVVNGEGMETTETGCLSSCIAVRNHSETKSFVCFAL